MSALTVQALHQELGNLLTANPELCEAFVSMSRDPEGNGFAVMDQEFYSTGVIEDARVHVGSVTDWNGKRTLVLWPGYPEFESVEDA